MSYIDNSGDIILDAVLTDLGRARIAAGKFNIAKFALGDEEINYKLWNPNHPQGSSFYDLEIMQTPILEAFTSDQSLMKTKLLTYDSDSLVYMPTLKINNKIRSCKPRGDFEGFYIAADSKTLTLNGLANVTAEHTQGFLPGIRGTTGTDTIYISVDQGIDASDASLTVADAFPLGLEETKYIVKLDSRLLELDGRSTDGAVERLRHQFIDDDKIMTYHITLPSPADLRDPQGDVRPAAFSPILRADNNTDPERNRQLRAEGRNPDIENITTYEMFEGPLGSAIRLVPRASTLVGRSTAFFDEFGASAQNLQFRGNYIRQYKYIDTTISVMGGTTGYSVDIPIRIVKGSDFGAAPI